MRNIGNIGFLAAASLTAFAAVGAGATPPPPVPIVQNQTEPDTAPPPPPPSLAAPATPRNQGRWAAMIANAYPAEAKEAGIEGTVGVKVTVGPNGRVEDCVVTRSTGHSILDAAACTGMRRYARFNPARDDSGNPTRGSFSTNITYRNN